MARTFRAVAATRTSIALPAEAPSQLNTPLPGTGTGTASIGPVRCFSSALNSPRDSPFASFNTDNISSLSNEELADKSTIPGWDLVHTHPRKFPRGALVGTVVSDKMAKTVNVAVDRHRIVPKYRKRVKYTRKFMAHDEKEVANLGDLVMIVPCHKLSRHKHFMLREIIKPKGQL
jgi:small subunit ribosomal protein S17